MQLLRFSLFGLLPLAFATPVADNTVALEARNGYQATNVILKALKAVKASTLRLDAGVLAINSTDLNDQVGVLTLVDNIIQTLNNQSKIIKKQCVIPQSSVLTVAERAQDLLDNVAKTLADTKSKRIQFFDPAQTTGIVRAALKEILVAADAFVVTLGKKVPKSAQFLVRGDKRQLDLLFADAIAFFPPAEGQDP